MRLFLTCLLASTLLMPLRAALLPYGSEIEVRLLHHVGSRTSHVGDSVEAVVITPVIDNGKVLVPAGARVEGSVEHVNKLGLGLRHTVARLDIHFNQLWLDNAESVALDARVASVETAREAVRTDGTVIGINPTANFSTGVSALFTLSNLAEREFRLPILVFKLLAARSPDAEISFPAGTEFLLRLNGHTELRAPSRQEPSIPLLSAAQISGVEAALQALPAQQTNRGDNHPSDLVNILLIGRRDEIHRAFHAAGWSTPETHGVMALYHMFHCAVERKSYSKLPMSILKLNGSVPNAAFEKSLNTFAKRHHVRFWQDAASGAWLGAATEDVSYRFHKAHMTHATDGHIDNERAKIVNDLAFTGCVEKGALIPRASLKPEQDFGSSIITDGDIAVLQLNNCSAPRTMPADPARPAPLRAIRAAFAVGEDLARSNPVSIAVALTAALLDAGSAKANASLQAKRTYARPSAVASASTSKADGSLAVR